MFAIKDFLKGILPLSHRRFTSEIEQLHNDLHNEILDEMNNDILSLEARLNEQIGTGNSEIKVLTKDIASGNEKQKEINDNIELLMRDVNSYQGQIDAIKEKIESLNGMVNDNMGKADRTNKVINSVLNQTLAIRTQIPVDRVVYADIHVERADFTKRFYAAMKKMDDFKEKYLALIDGLDDDSIELITRILRRIQMSADSEDDIMNVYSLEEQNGIRKMWDHFDKNILKLDDDLYAYKNYILPYNSFNPSVLYYFHGLDTLSSLDMIMKKDIIDAGAFIGDSAVVLSRYTEKKVYSFEAVHTNYEMMEKTLKLNHIENVVPVNAAISDHNGTLDIYLADEIDNCSISGSDDTKKIEVEAVTIDSYAKEHNLDIGLMKIDVEGAEQSLLRGSLETIKSKKPVIMISIYHNADDFFSIKPMIESLQLGYTFRIYRPPMMNILTDTILICEVK